MLNLLGHADFARWIESEFGWSRRTYTRLLKVADVFSDRLTRMQQFRASALYRLAMDNAPEGAIDEACDLADRGVVISGTLADELVSKHRPQRGQPQQPIWKLRYFVRRLAQKTSPAQRREIARTMLELASELKPSV